MPYSDTSSLTLCHLREYGIVTVIQAGDLGVVNVWLHGHDLLRQVFGKEELSGLDNSA